MMPVPKKNWRVKVIVTEAASGPAVEVVISLGVVLPTVNDIVQITDFKRLLAGEYHDAYRVMEIGLGKGQERMLLKMTRLRKDADEDRRFTSKPAVYDLGQGRYQVDLKLSPGGQVAQRKKIPAIPLMGDFLQVIDEEQFVSLNDPGFGSGDPEFPVKVRSKTLLRVVAAYHSWTWLRPGTLRDGTPSLEVEQTNLSTRSEAALAHPPTFRG